jgi:hypothetical protein
VAVIARYDWPDYWPNLMDDLISMLRQGSTDQLEGAMEVVTEMVREEFGPDQLPTIASSLLPTLLDILRNESVSLPLYQEYQDGGFGLRSTMISRPVTDTFGRSSG